MRNKFILTIENKDDEYIFTKAIEDGNDGKIDKNREKIDLLRQSKMKTMKKCFTRIEIGD